MTSLWDYVFLNIGTPEKFAEITLKFDQGGFTIMRPNDAEGIANDQTAPLGHLMLSDKLIKGATWGSDHLGWMAQDHGNL